MAHRRDAREQLNSIFTTGGKLQMDDDDDDDDSELDDDDGVDRGPNAIGQAHIRNSDTNKELFAILTMLNHAVELADVWLDEHDDDCECEYCEAGHTSGRVRDDLVGIAWAARWGASAIEAATVGPDDLEEKRIETKRQKLKADRAAKPKTTELSGRAKAKPRWPRVKRTGREMESGRQLENLCKLIRMPTWAELRAELNKCTPVYFD